MWQKNSYCTNGGHRQHLFLQHDFPFDTYRSVANSNSKEQALLIDQDSGKSWIEIFCIIEDLSIRSIWYHSKWHERKPWVMFPIKSNRFVMLCSHSTINDSSGLCYKLLCIPQMVTEIQKVHISIHDGLPNFLTPNMLNIGPRIGDRVAGICLSLTKYYICQVIGLVFSDWNLFTT